MYLSYNFNCTSFMYKIGKVNSFPNGIGVFMLEIVLKLYTRKQNAIELVMIDCIL